MPSVTPAAGPIHLGMDTPENTIVVGILMPGEEAPVLDRIWNDEDSVRRLAGRFGDPAALRCCYEAGPGGFELHRLLTSMGIACDVVAPSLIPRRAGERVKTDRRDASRLARLHRAGELTPVRVPAEAEEAVRDLVRARAALLADRKRAQQRITAMLMRHGQVWRSSYWTLAHEQWIAGQRFGEPALAAALAHYRAALDTRRTELDAIEAELKPWTARPPLAEAVARLGCYRGIAELTGLTLAAEVAGWRRFPRGERSWVSPAWCPPSIPAASAPAAVPSPRQGPHPPAPPSSRPRGPTGTSPRSVSPCATASTTPARRRWPAPGRRSAGCIRDTSR
jgi:transposase